MGVSKIRGTFLGVPKIRTIVYWGLCWGTLILGKLPYTLRYIIDIPGGQTSIVEDLVDSGRLL